MSFPRRSPDVSAAGLVATTAGRPVALALMTGFLLVGMNCGTAPVGTIHYRLLWDESRIMASPNTGTNTTTNAGPIAGPSVGWSVITDLGYEVRVDRGWLVSSGLTLVPCGDDVGWAGAGNFGVGTAYAGHSGEVDLSGITSPIVESLTEPAVVEWRSSKIPSTRYCQLHYLLARSDERAVADAAQVDMRGFTLWIDAAYRAPGSAREHPLSVRIASAHGGLSGLGQVDQAHHARREKDGTIAAVETGRGDYGVTLRRDLGALFDGIELDDALDEEIERQLLRNVIDNVGITVGAIEPSNTREGVPGGLPTTVDSRHSRPAADPGE